MHDILQTLQSPRLIPALEANLEEEMLCFGRGLGGGEVYNDGEIEGFFTGRGHLNGVLRTHLRGQDPGHRDERIHAALAYFRARRIGEIGWSLGQDCQPADMHQHLMARGFRTLPEENIGMALDIASLQAETGAIQGLDIRELRDREDLRILRQIEIEGFGSSQELAQCYYEMYTGVGFGPGTCWRHFVGWLQGQAVTSTSLLFYAGVAGLYGVATIPVHRRQGLARAMVLHASDIARQAGYQIVVLSPTEMSERIYRRLGFRPYTCIHHYLCTL
ncbi:MAG TPA: GNAT family N-acetyltransferase [Ktedonobacteraceae bacterium]